MRVLLATGIKQLDKDLQERLGEEAAICYYREAVMEEAEKGEIAVLSSSLPGRVSIEDIIMGLRMKNLRVILLPGAFKENEKLVRRAVALGIYDFVFDPVTVEEVIRHIEHPATLADVGKIAGEVSESALPEGIMSDNSKQEDDTRRALSGLDRIKKLARHLPARKEAFSRKAPKPDEEFQYEAPIYRDEVEHEENQSQAPGGTGKIIAVACPWAGSGSVDLTIALARRLPGKTAVVDLNLKAAGLATCLGLRPFEIEGRDWRRGGFTVFFGGVAVFPLDPSREYPVKEEDLSRLLNEAGRAQWTVLEMGSDPEAWWFAELAGRIDVMLWAVQYDQMEYVVARWKRRPDMGCREFAVLLGGGDARVVEEALVVPCLRIRGVKDNKGLNRLVETVHAIPKHRGKRVMAVGFKKTPDVPGAVVDVFRNAEEAITWLQVNRPDVVLISADLAGKELLVYDLQVLKVPFRIIPG